jgi:hypothetical protein
MYWLGVTDRDKVARMWVEEKARREARVAAKAAAAKAARGAAREQMKAKR